MKSQTEARKDDRIYGEEKDNRAEGAGIVLFHYPILEWDCFFRGAIHLYGHVHNSELSAKRVGAVSGLAFNVGVDCNNLKPVSIEDIIALSEIADTWAGK